MINISEYCTDEQLKAGTSAPSCSLATSGELADRTEKWVAEPLLLRANDWWVNRDVELGTLEVH